MPPSRRSIKRETLIYWIALPLLGIVTAIVFAEIALSMYRPYKFASIVSGDQFQMYQFDKTLGWRQLPNISTTFRRREFKHNVTTNSWGMRDRPLQKNAPYNKTRIAFLGDSYAWGHGVEIEDRFSEVLMQRAPTFEALNFGVSGYSPIQYLLMLDEVLSFNPSVIVILACPMNDYADITLGKRYGYFKPYAQLDADGKLQIIDSHVVPTALYHTNYPTITHLLGALTPYSHIADMLRVQLRQPEERNNDGQLGLHEIGARQVAVYRFQTKKDHYGAMTAAAINRAIYREIQFKLYKKQIRFVVALAPSKCELGQCDPERYVRPNGARELLTADMEELSIPLIDPTDRYTVDDFYDVDVHWRPSGHIKMADALREFPLLTPIK